MGGPVWTGGRFFGVSRFPPEVPSAGLGSWGGVGKAEARFAEPAAEFSFVPGSSRNCVCVFYPRQCMAMALRLRCVRRSTSILFFHLCVRERERELSLDLRHQVVCRSTVKASEFCMPRRGLGPMGLPRCIRTRPAPGQNLKKRILVPETVPSTWCQTNSPMFQPLSFFP